MFKREFKINFKSLILWTFILLGIYALIFIMYPSLINEETKKSLEMMMNTMPKEILSNFNMDIVGIETAYGWFKTEGFMFLTIVGGLYAAIMGSTILLKEESDKTIEFLYAKPVSRNKIVTSKVLCGFLNILLFTSVITIGNYLFLNSIEDFVLKEFLMISLIPLLLYLLLFFISMFLGTFLKKTKKAMSFAVFIVFASYFMQIIGSMGESLEIIKKISLFEFVSSRYIILNGCLNMNYIYIGVCLLVVFIACIYLRYNRKEFL